MKQDSNRINVNNVDRLLHGDTAENGLDPRTVTRAQLEKGLKLVMGFAEDDTVMVLKAADERGLRHVSIAYPTGNDEVRERLEQALAGMATGMAKGTSTMKRKGAYGPISIGVNTLEFDIAQGDASIRAARARVAAFINAEARGAKEAGEPELWTLVSAIQNPEPQSKGRGYCS